CRLLSPAVALSAWVGGGFGGFSSTIALSLGTAYYLLPPAGIAVDDPADLVRLGTFTVSGAFVAWLSGALKESQGVMMATLRSIGDAVIATDRRGTVRFLNPVAETLTGWSHKDAKGRPLTEVFRTVHPDTGEAVPISNVSAPGSVISLENVCLISKDGRRLPIDDSMATVEVETGTVFGSILVFRDATKRRESEAAILESQRRQLQAQ